MANFHSLKPLFFLQSSSSDSGSVPFGRTSNELSRVLKEKEVGRCTSARKAKEESCCSSHLVISITGPNRSSGIWASVIERRYTIAQEWAEAAASYPGSIRCLSSQLMQSFISIGADYWQRSETQNSEPQQRGDEATASKATVNKRPPTEQEKRRINQLIKRYLVERGYKLTAITFGEEACAIPINWWRLHNRN